MRVMPELPSRTSPLTVMVPKLLTTASEEFSSIKMPCACPSGEELTVMVPVSVLVTVVP